MQLYYAIQPAHLEMDQEMSTWLPYLKEIAPLWSQLAFLKELLTGAAGDVSPPPNTSLFTVSHSYAV